VPNGAATTLAALPEGEQNRVFAGWAKTSVVAALGEWLAQHH
jgi:inosine triphosphate pyrophosphatase/XTP/dITP diphosphohydrolase